MHLTLQHFFDAERVNFHAFVGWMVVLANLINSMAAALYLMFVVRCTSINTWHAASKPRQAHCQLCGR